MKWMLELLEVAEEEAELFALSRVIESSVSVILKSKIDFTSDQYRSLV